MKRYFWHGLYDDVDNCKHLHEMSKGIDSLDIRPTHGGGGAVVPTYIHNHKHFHHLNVQEPFYTKICTKNITVVVS